MDLGSARLETARVPKLVSGCDTAGLPLSPAEGYLLSRVDGQTSWGILREIGGLAPADVDRCLRRWLEQGLLEVREPTETSQAAVPAPEVLLDPSLDLAVDAQQRILAFEARLDLPYHEILGVPRQADPKAVKRAYFELSKEFHPDRYFRREIGPYAIRLARVFARIAEAYELLSDPTIREEVERSLEESPGPTVAPAPSAPATASAQAAASAARRTRAALNPANLRQLTQRKRKAKTFFEAGMSAFRAERWFEAAASVRLAIAFDPVNQAYKEAFGPAQRKAADERGRQLAREAERALEMRDHREALRLYEESLHHRPHDPAGNYEAARLVMLLGEDLKRAKEYAARACELVPENAAYRCMLGRIYREAGLVANARRELEAALRIDPNDGSVRAELRALG